MASPTRQLSSELLAGQERLRQLRQHNRGENNCSSYPKGEIAHGRSPHPSQNSLSEITQMLPSHLGWGSQVATNVLRSSSHNKSNQVDPLPAKLERVEWQPRQEESQKAVKNYVKLYPDFAIGLLESGTEAVGRIWLLLRYLDSDGRGWLTIEEVKNKLSHSASSLKVCGWRQLRNLLNRGETIFWTRGHGRIWLHSQTKVAAALRISRLKLRPVALPISVLITSIGQVRAHFYATFHSGRAKSDASRELQKPISRATVTQMTKVHKRTQRRYEKIAKVQKKYNYSLAGKDSKLETEQRAWKHGRALFKLKDVKGIQGKPGNVYLAWQLPNSYVGPHKQLPKGKQKRINQALSDLFMQGMTGNGESHIEKRFYPNGRLAAHAFNRQPASDIYWYDSQLNLWHCMKKQSGKNDPPF